MPTANCEITVEDVNKYIHLQGIRCKMNFESPIQKIDHDLLTEPPTVSVFCKEDGENVKFAEAELDVGLLLLKKEVHKCIFFKDYKIFMCQLHSHCSFITAIM